MDSLARCRAACMVLLAASPVARAGPGLDGMGAAGAGVSGAATAGTAGPASVFHNPAALATREGFQLEVGGAVAVPLALRATRARPTLPNPRRWRPAVVTPPMVFAAWGNGELGAGLGVYAPQVHAWAFDRAAVPEGVSGSDEKLLAVDAAMGHRVGPLAVGGGLALLGALVEERHALAAGSASVQAAGAGVRAHVGLLVEVSPRLTAGAHARTRSLVGLLGRARFDGCPTACPAGGRVDGVRALPDSLAVGLGWRPWAAGRVTLDAEVQAWAAQGGGFASPSGDVVLPGLAARRRGTLAARAGVEQVLWWVAPDLRVRAGLSTQSAAVPDGRASPAWPWGPKAGASVGAGWRYMGITLDAAWAGEWTWPWGDGRGAAWTTTTQVLVASVGYGYAPR
ncbi:MAG: hypothetical protein HY904_03825 [Deltaproteobacteria bacterium]|nr:hypothetical protein [Deltaproteobacteria bacterium]